MCSDREDAHLHAFWPGITGMTGTDHPPKCYPRSSGIAGVPQLHQVRILAFATTVTAALPSLTL
jgi:hypothetical protein